MVHVLAITCTTHLPVTPIKVYDIGRWAHINFKLLHSLSRAGALYVISPQIWYKFFEKSEVAKTSKAMLVIWIGTVHSAGSINRAIINYHQGGFANKW